MRRLDPTTVATVKMLELDVKVCEKLHTNLHKIIMH